MQGRGGARPNSGPKPIYSLSNDEKELLYIARKKAAQGRGRDLSDILMDLIYDDDKSLQIKALKLYFDNMVAKSSESHKTIEEIKEPGVFLPEERPDPAKVYAIDGGKKNVDTP